MAAVTLDLSNLRDSKVEESTEKNAEGEKLLPEKKTSLAGRMDKAESMKSVNRRTEFVPKKESEEDIDIIDDDAHHAELVEAAEAHMKEKLPGGGVLDFFSSPVVFGQFGIGIELYFRFTRVMTLTMTVLAVLYMPLLILNMLGDSLKLTDMSNVGMASQVLLSTMLPNLGTVDITNESDSFSVNDTTLLTASATDITVNSSAGFYGKNITYERNVYFLSKFNIKDITFFTGLLDAIASLIVLLVAFWFEFHEIPRCVASHRNEFVTPRIYSIYVDCLPKRIFGGGGHEAYSKRLKQHFELLLEAQVTTKSATLNMKVVSADETWCRRPDGAKQKRRFNSRFCPKRDDGYDDQGRRTGHIIKLSGTSCVVQWDKTETDESEPKKCRMSNGEEDGELLDASLLWSMESVGLNPVPSGDKAPEHENAVYAVSMQRDFDNSLEKMKAQESAKNRRLEQKIRQGARKGRSKSLVVRDFKKNMDVETDLDFNADVKLEERDVVGAFVIFTHTQYRDFIHAEYRFTRTPFRQCLAARRLQFSGQTLRVQDAVAPTEVFWNNLDFDEYDRFKRRIVVLICCVLIIGAVIFCVAFAKQQALTAKASIEVDCDQGQTMHHFCLCIAAGYYNVMQDDPPGIYELCEEWAHKRFTAGVWSLLASIAVCATCGISGFLVGYLALAVKPISISDLNQLVLHMTTIIYVLCLGVVNVFVNAKLNMNLWVLGKGEHEDMTPKWYITVGTSTMLTIVVNAFYPIVSLLQCPLYFLMVRLMKNRKRLLIDLYELYTPPEFPFALRHAEQMSQICILLLFCSGMPVLAPLAPLTYALYYWTDKYTFLRASEIPPRYSEKLLISQVQLLQFAVWCHCSVAAWVYSNQETAPSHGMTAPSQATAFEDHMLGVEDPDEKKKSISSQIADRLFLSSALPSTVVSMLIMFTLLLRLLFFTLGHNMIVYLEHHIPTWLAQFLVGGDFDEFNAESSFVNEISSMKRRGVPICYDVDKVKGYEFLQDDKEKLQAQKAAYWRMALGNIESARSDNQAEEVIKVLQASSRGTTKGLRPVLTAGPLADTIGAQTAEKSLKKSMSAVATARKVARQQKKTKSSPAAGERDKLVTVDAVRLSMKGKGKGKGTRTLKRKTRDVRQSEVEPAKRAITNTSNAALEEIPTDAAAFHHIVGHTAQSKREKTKQAKYLSGMDPFPKPDNLDDYLKSLHQDDLTSARQRLGIRRTLLAHEDLITSASNKFKLKGKGKGKRVEVPAWAMSEDREDTVGEQGKRAQRSVVTQSDSKEQLDLEARVQDAL